VLRGGCTVELQPEWNEFLSTLKRHGVRFLLVGAHAASVGIALRSYAGQTRTTVEARGRVPET
jgi:hypothetical protein